MLSNSSLSAVDQRGLLASREWLWLRWPAPAYTLHTTAVHADTWIIVLFWAASFVTCVWWMNLSNRSLVTHADFLRYPKTVQCPPYKSGERRRRNIKIHNPDARLTSDEVQRANGAIAPPLRPVGPSGQRPTKRCSIARATELYSSRRYGFCKPLSRANAAGPPQRYRILFQACSDPSHI